MSIYKKGVTSLYMGTVVFQFNMLLSERLELLIRASAFRAFPHGQHETTEFELEDIWFKPSWEFTTTHFKNIPLRSTKDGANLHQLTSQDLAPKHAQEGGRALTENGVRGFRSGSSWSFMRLCDPKP